MKLAIWPLALVMLFMLLSVNHVDYYFYTLMTPKSPLSKMIADVLVFLGLVILAGWLEQKVNSK
jgi:hypothetical protein